MKVVVRQRVELADSFVPGSGAGRTHLISITLRRKHVCLSACVTVCLTVIIASPLRAFRPRFSVWAVGGTTSRAPGLVTREAVAAGAELLSVCVGPCQVGGIYLTVFCLLLIDLDQSPWPRVAAVLAPGLLLSSGV